MSDKRIGELLTARHAGQVFRLSYSHLFRLAPYPWLIVNVPVAWPFSGAGSAPCTSQTVSRAGLFLFGPGRGTTKRSDRGNLRCVDFRPEQDARQPCCFARAQRHDAGPGRRLPPHRPPRHGQQFAVRRSCGCGLAIRLLLGSGHVTPPQHFKRRSGHDQQVQGDVRMRDVPEVECDAGLHVGQ